MLAQVSKLLPAFTWPRSHKMENDGDPCFHMNLSVSLLGLSKRLGYKTCVPRRLLIPKHMEDACKGGHDWLPDQSFTEKGG